MRTSLKLVFLVALSCMVISGCSDSTDRTSGDVATVKSGENIQPFTGDKMLLMFREDRQLGIFDPETMKLLQRIQLDQPPKDYEISLDRTYFVSLTDTPGTSAKVMVIDSANGQLSEIQSDSGSLHLVEISDSGTGYVASGILNDQNENQIFKFDASTKKLLPPIYIPGVMEAIDLIGNDEYLVAANNFDDDLYGNIYRLDGKTGKREALFDRLIQPLVPTQIIVDQKNNLAYLLIFNSYMDDEMRKKFEPLVEDPSLLSTHVAVFDLSANKMIRRIPLDQPVYRMVIDDQDKMYGISARIKEDQLIQDIVVTDLKSGASSTLPTVNSPDRVYIQGKRLYVTSEFDPEMDIFELPSLKKIGRATFDSIPMLPFETND